MMINVTKQLLSKACSNAVLVATLAAKESISYISQAKNFCFNRNGHRIM